MKQIITSLLLFTICFAGFAQRGDKMMQEKVRAHKIAFITERLDLSPDEAQNFWPIYNAFEKKTNDFKKKDLRGIKEAMKKDDLSEKEAKDILNRFMDIEEQIHQAKKQLVKDLEKAIPAQKIIQLKATEDAFNHRLMSMLKERRQERMKRN